MSTNDCEQYEFCPRCDANLTLQKGYSNTLPYWVCKGCGEMLINPAIDAPDDIAWICDKCGAMLNIQQGFEDNGGIWQCTECGFTNHISEKELYDTEEAYIADLGNPYRGLSDEDVLYLTSFIENDNVDGRSDIIKVIDSTGKKYIKKYLTIYDISIYEYLKENPVEHMPRIIYLAKGSNCLIVLEEYIEGTSLNDLISEEKINEADAVAITVKLCKILDTLHSLPDPIIHRDVKPSNVIVDQNGEVFLLDMNAAKWYEPDKFSDSDCFGTKFYASPEQLGYGLKASSAKSDIYAIGVLLNVMLTGDFPQKKTASEPYRTIIRRCISLESDKRYTATELINALNSIGE